MDWIARAFGRTPRTMIALGVWICLPFTPAPSALGGDLGPDGPGRFGGKLFRGHRRVGAGTLGYGPPGLHPGFPGFGLSYHRGYGYGGNGLGVGANGGYPGYEGPGYPCPSAPTRFPAVGPLVADRPAAYSGDGRDPGAAYETGYGPYTGALPDPSRFAPYATEAPRAPAAAPPPPSGP